MSNNAAKSINCPNCGSTIYFSSEGLLRGESFHCSKCQCTIRLPHSSCEILKDAIDKFNDLKEKK